MQGRMYTAYQTYYGAPVASVAWPQQLTSTVGVNQRMWYEERVPGKCGSSKYGTVYW